MMDSVLISDARLNLSTQTLTGREPGHWHLYLVLSPATTPFFGKWSITSSQPNRLHRILRNVDSPNCNLCQSQQICSLPHALFTCNHNSDVGNWLLRVLDSHLPGIVPQQVVLLNINIEDQLRLPIVWLIAKTLNTIFTCRMEKKACTLFNTRAQLEASVMLLMKTLKNCKH